MKCTLLDLLCTEVICPVPNSEYPVQFHCFVFTTKAVQLSEYSCQLGCSSSAHITTPCVGGEHQTIF